VLRALLPTRVFSVCSSWVVLVPLQCVSTCLVFLGHRPPLRGPALTRFAVAQGFFGSDGIPFEQIASEQMLQAVSPWVTTTWWSCCRWNMRDWACAPRSLGAASRRPRRGDVPPPTLCRSTCCRSTSVAAPAVAAPAVAGWRLQLTGGTTTLSSSSSSSFPFLCIILLSNRGPLVRVLVSPYACVFTHT